MTEAPIKPPYSFTIRKANGETTTLARYQGKVMLIVNVASRCGFTPQYDGMEALQTKYAERGFSVLGFPCNQFGRQEPGDDEAIQGFCAMRRVTFPVFAKIDVNGVGAHALYAWLKAERGGLITSAIKWNFTKFLVARNGVVLGRFPPTTTPQALEPAIEAALGPDE